MEKSENFDRDFFKERVFDSNHETQNEFRKYFERNIQDFIDWIYIGFLRWKKFDNLLSTTYDTDQRLSWVNYFLYQSVNNLLMSFHLLVSGYLIPSGNMMRQFLECISMSLLCSHPESKEYKKFISSPEKYSFHKAINKLDNIDTINQLGLFEMGVKSLIMKYKWRNKYSHITTFSIGYQFLNDISDSLMICGYYDLGKHDAYHFEIKDRINAAK